MFGRVFLYPNLEESNERGILSKGEDDKMDNPIKKQGNRVWIYCRVDCPDDMALKFQDLAILRVSQVEKAGLSFLIALLFST